MKRTVETPAISVILAIEDEALRASTRSALEPQRDIQVIGETSDDLSAPQLVEYLRPDVLVLDRTMNTANDLDITRQLAHRSPRTRLMVVSINSETHMLQALQAGVEGYVVQQSIAPDLVQAIRGVATDYHYVRRISQPYLDEAIKFYLNNARVFDGYGKLNEREREILPLAARSITNKEIARLWRMSHRTVELHRQRMMRKLGFSNSTELVLYAIRIGILPLWED